MNEQKVTCSGGKLDGLVMTRSEIVKVLGLSGGYVCRSIIDGIFYDKSKPERQHLVNGDMLTLSEIMVLPDAAIMSREAMRRRLTRGIPYNRPNRRDAEEREIDARRRRDENPSPSRFVIIGDTEVVSSKHKHFCKGLAAFAAMRVIRC